MIGTMPKDITGKKYGRLTVVSLDYVKQYSQQTKAYWLCLCSCGETKSIRGDHLTSGRVESCGCLARELASSRLTKHGKSGSRTYRIWCGVKQRCINKAALGDAWKKKAYKDTELCERWLSFSAFLEDMGECPTPSHEIDRVDPYGNYEPSNCRWATRREQMLNQRRNHDIYSLYSSLEPVVSYKMFRDRMRRNWPAKQAAQKPKMKNQFI